MGATAQRAARSINEVCTAAELTISKVENET